MIREADQMPTCELTITLAGPNDSFRCERFEIGGHPELIIARLAKSGLDYFRKHSS
jgi:hypothetical protein